MSNDIQKYVDKSMFKASPIKANRDEKGNILPRVILLSMNPDPLGSIAAMARQYKGLPTYSLNDITDEDRIQYFKDCQATHLKAPLESVTMHFFIEGVTRSFTHQMVRQRTAVYAQESMRFAVKDNLKDEIALPPSVAVLKEDDPRRVVWDNVIGQVGEGYNQLVSAGIPAEDARGLLPHATTTRLNYVTNLRALSDHAGNRLCTQAQFEWRYVFLGIVNAIRDYNPDLHTPHASEDCRHIFRPFNQFEAIAESSLFRPICYELGRCPFQASFDRPCTIRERVELHKEKGESSEKWTDINPAEWLADPTAAWDMGDN